VLPYVFALCCCCVVIDYGKDGIRQEIWAQTVFRFSLMYFVLDNRNPGDFFCGGGRGGCRPPTPPPQKKKMAPRLLAKKSLALAVKADTVTSKMIEDLKIETLRRIEEVYQKFETHYQRNFVRPIINFDLKGNRSGVAYFYSNLIRLNANLLLDYKKEFIQRTPGHEVAHLVARFVYGEAIKSHGAEWQFAMRVIEQKPERCHSFIVKTKNIYHCNCDQIHYLSTRRHNQSLRGDITMTCQVCKNKLIWEKILPAN
jgi:SprT protein